MKVEFSTQNVTCNILLSWLILPNLTFGLMPNLTSTSLGLTFGSAFIPFLPFFQEGCRYNALHVCAMKNQPAAAMLILETLEDAAFMARLYPQDAESARGDRIHHMLDLYLNMPDKGVWNSQFGDFMGKYNLNMILFFIFLLYVLPVTLCSA